MITLKVHKGTNKNPTPDQLYCVYTRASKGGSFGKIILGSQCNWLSSEIVGWSALPVYVSEVCELFSQEK